MDLRQIDALQGCLDKTTAKLDELNKDKKSIELLETIPGVGPRTAEAIVAGQCYVIINRGSTRTRWERRL